MLHHIQLAVSEGERLDTCSYTLVVTAEGNFVNGAQDAQLKGHVGDAAAAISTQSTPQQWMSHHLE